MERLKDAGTIADKRRVRSAAVTTDLTEIEFSIGTGSPLGFFGSILALSSLGQAAPCPRKSAPLWSEQVRVRCQKPCVHNYVGVERCEDATGRVCRVLSCIVSSRSGLGSRQGICISHRKQVGSP